MITPEARAKGRAGLRARFRTEDERREYYRTIGSVGNASREARKAARAGAIDEVRAALSALSVAVERLATGVER